MKGNLIVLAIPFFFLLIGLELLAEWRTKKGYYRLNDSINNLSCGVLDQLLAVFLKATLLGGYLFLYRHAPWQVSESSAAGWLALFLGLDFCYYWFHRASHEINALWGSHVVHHQSEEYNLTVALRQAAFQRIFSWFFYLPLAILGFPPEMFLTVGAINTLYQFWIHTRFIGKLGPLEWVFNTPSHHRVHHASDPKYLDKNYAGILIVWDRLFGTFQAEEEEPRYGITKPLESWNPLWANVQQWVDLAKATARLQSWRSRALYWLRPPGWQPPEQPSAPAKGKAPRGGKYDPEAPALLKLYVLAHFAVVLGVAVHFLQTAETPDAGRLLLFELGLVVGSLAIFGALLESRRWGLKLEIARLALCALLLPWISTALASFLPVIALSGVLLWKVYSTTSTHVLQAVP